MNRIREFDVAFTPRISGTPAAPVWADGLRLKALKRKTSERIADLEPELTALAVIAPFVIAVLAALPTFAAA
ncbi:MAG TPA: hypothetical protein VN805_15110 [Caulobacteraceae bacterium]|nr:hypothetical protein [Caulobacteraceae bacterium]